jgi:DNA-directed RNA polymerase specialized sigma24 family protein
MGDAEAWGALVDCYGPKVWSVTKAFGLSPEDAADVSRAAWTRMAERIHLLPKTEAFGASLLTIAKRECLALVRRSHKNVPGADAGCEGELWRAFSHLPPASQLLLRLLFSDPPLSYEEIAAVTGMRMASIGPARARCLARLRTVHQGNAAESRRTPARNGG